jgi:hypothetical protein
MLFRARRPNTRRTGRSQLGCERLESRLALSAALGVPAVVAVNPQPLPPSGIVTVYHPPQPCHPPNPCLS